MRREQEYAGAKMEEKITNSDNVSLLSSVDAVHFLIFIFDLVGVRL